MPEAIELARRNEINVVASNPCIELWFILHHEDQTAHIEREAAQRRSAELLACGKHLTSDALATLDPHYADAVRRAKQLMANTLVTGVLRAATRALTYDVWRLAERILMGNQRLVRRRPSPA